MKTEVEQEDCDRSVSFALREHGHKDSVVTFPCTEMDAYSSIDCFKLIINEVIAVSQAYFFNPLHASALRDSLRKLALITLEENPHQLENAMATLKNTLKALTEENDNSQTIESDEGPKTDEEQFGDVTKEKWDEDNSKQGNSFCEIEEREIPECSSKNASQNLMRMVCSKEGKEGGYLILSETDSTELGTTENLNEVAPSAMNQNTLTSPSSQTHSVTTNFHGPSVTVPKLNMSAVPMRVPTKSEAPSFTLSQPQPRDETSTSSETGEINVCAGPPNAPYDAEKDYMTGYKHIPTLHLNSCHSPISTISNLQGHPCNYLPTGNQLHHYLQSNPQQFYENSVHGNEIGVHTNLFPAAQATMLNFHPSQYMQISNYPSPSSLRSGLDAMRPCPPLPQITRSHSNLIGSCSNFVQSACQLPQNYYQPPSHPSTPYDEIEPCVGMSPLSWNQPSHYPRPSASSVQHHSHSASGALHHQSLQQSTCCTMLPQMLSHNQQRTRTSKLYQKEPLRKKSQKEADQHNTTGWTPFKLLSKRFRFCQE